MAGAASLAGLGQGPPEAEVRVVVDLVGLDDGLELGRRLGVVAAPEEGAAQGLAHRALLGRLASGLLQGHSRLLEVTVLQQLHSSPVERVERLAALCLLILIHETSVKGAIPRLAGR